MRQPESQSNRFTAGQMKLEKILNNLGFSTVLELEVDNYRIDVFVPELKCGFEFDGKGFHMKKHDAERDKKIQEVSGFKIIRVKGEDLKPEYIKRRIAEDIDGNNDSV